MCLFLDKTDNREAAEHSVVRRKISESTRRSAPVRPSLHPISRHVPDWLVVHRGRYPQLHWRRPSQLLQNENGNYFVTLFWNLLNIIKQGVWYLATKNKQCWLDSQETLTQWWTRNKHFFIHFDLKFILKCGSDRPIFN